MKRGLYLVSPDWDDTQRLLEVTSEAINGGATCVQYRHKGASAKLKRTQAEALRDLTQASGVTFIVNDDVELALAVGADGVHLGRDDGDVSLTRARCGDHYVIGVSCYDDFGRARRAEQDGANYIAFGAMFRSPTKPHAASAPLELVTRAVAQLRVPVACIGGITVGNARGLVEAGASWLAVISDIYSAQDPRLQARRFADLYS